MSTQQSSQLSSQAARSTAAQSARPVLHARQLEPEEDASSVGSPLNLTAVEAARPYLLLKAIINLEDTTEEWKTDPTVSQSLLLLRPWQNPSGLGASRDVTQRLGYSAESGEPSSIALAKTAEYIDVLPKEAFRGKHSGVEALASISVITISYILFFENRNIVSKIRNLSNLLEKKSCV